jgi:Flp pilus assembly protein protease CpaA
MMALVASPLFHAVVTVVLLLAAAASDLRSRRVPLWLTGAGIAGGALVAVLMGPPMLWTSAVGLTVGVLLFLPFVFLHGFGGADALLLGLVGVWLGWRVVLWTAWWTAVAGAVLAVLAWRRGQRSFPYVPAIVVGTVLALLVR